MSRIFGSVSTSAGQAATAGTNPTPAFLPTREQLHTPVTAENLPNAEDPTAVLTEQSAPRVESSHLPESNGRHWMPDSSRLLFLNNTGKYVAAIEQFRSVRSRLWQIRQRQPFSKILVSSARPREGRTFVSANLAHALVRQKGKRVLLVDGDLRNPTLHTYLGASREPGLSNYLAANVNSSEIVQNGSIRDLSFIPGGAPSSDAAELLSNGRLEELLKACGDYDWIVVDSPSLATVCDASILSDSCDGVLLVVEAARTSVELVERAQHEFAKPILGVVLNRLNGTANNGQTKTTA
ncbi:MAG TPA: CpsD/CapB family tyrosine-protein kinase [Candidatus Acidoferrales bacterium]|nr:CpsD/CapB family tyrosine-protein kinase [Candidatus Acidoferrales bacterium]